MDTPAATQPPHQPTGQTTCPQVILSTGSLFHLPLPVIARLGRAAGFHGLDLVMGSEKIAPGRAVEEAHALLPVRVVHAPFRNWSAFGGHMNAWRAAASLAAAVLGPDNPRVHVTLHPPGGALRDAIQTRWFARAVDLPRLLGAAPGVDFSLENLPWAGSGGGLFSADSLAELIRECQDKCLGLTLDVCHLGVSGRDVLADLARVLAIGQAGLIRHVHCSDAANHREHLPPGTGALPVGPFLAGLGRAGYGGTVSLELDPSCLPECTPGSEAELVRELAALRQGMERALSGDPPPAWCGQGAGGCVPSHTPGVAFG